MVDEKTIRQFVNESSGGIKFAELLIRCLESGQVERDESRNLDALLESKVRSMEDLGVLDYSWHMTPNDPNGPSRSKMFVYEKE